MKIVSISQEEFVQSVCIDPTLRNFVIDSRVLNKGDLFFALHGARVDGHEFIADAIEAGARGIVGKKSWFRRNSNTVHKILEIRDSKAPKIATAKKDLLIVEVDDCLRCLLEAAKAIALRSSAQKIGITGSSGKTTVKELLRSVLEVGADIYYSKGNFNSIIGLPLELAGMPENIDYAVFEMAISERGEMQKLVDIVQPHHVILTNIGTAHIGNIGSIEAIAQEKFHIFSRIEGFAVIPADDTNTQNYIKKHPLSCPVLEYGLGKKFGFRIIEEHQDNSEISKKSNNHEKNWKTRFTYGKDEYAEYEIPLGGRHNLSNACAVITLARALGFDKTTINAGFRSFTLPQGRGNLCWGESILLNDSYNANPQSMAASIDYALNIAQREDRSLCIIFGDMLELGEWSSQAHSKVLEAAISANPRCIFLLGKHFAQALQDRKEKIRNKGIPTESEEIQPVTRVRSFLKHKDLANSLLKHATLGDVFLVKASRGMQIENCIPCIPGLSSEECPVLGTKNLAKEPLNNLLI